MAKRNGTSPTPPEPPPAATATEPDASEYIFIQDPLQPSAEECLALLADWINHRTGIVKYLEVRDVHLEVFMDSLRRYDLLEVYYQARESWQRKIDTEMIQQGVVNIRNAIAAGDVETSKWLLERRTPLLYGSVQDQIKLAEYLRYSGGYLAGDLAEPKVIGLNPETGPAR